MKPLPPPEENRSAPQTLPLEAPYIGLEQAETEQTISSPKPPSSETPRTAGFFLCARHVVRLGGGSPLRTVVTGTASLGKGARREAGSEGSRRQNTDPTNRNRIEGRRGGVTRQWTGKPKSHPNTRAGKSGGARGKASRLTLGDLAACPDEPDYRGGNDAGRAERSQPRP
jgi:hypothetical protein